MSRKPAPRKHDLDFLESLLERLEDLPERPAVLDSMSFIRDNPPRSLEITTGIKKPQKPRKKGKQVEPATQIAASERSDLESMRARSRAEREMKAIMSERNKAEARWRNQVKPKLRELSTQLFGRYQMLSTLVEELRPYDMIRSKSALRSHQQTLKVYQACGRPADAISEMRARVKDARDYIMLVTRECKETDFRRLQHDGAWGLLYKWLGGAVDVSWWANIPTFNLYRSLAIDDVRDLYMRLRLRMGLPAARIEGERLLVLYHVTARQQSIVKECLDQHRTLKEINERLRKSNIGIPVGADESALRREFSLLQRIGALVHVDGSGYRATARRVTVSNARQ